MFCFSFLSSLFRQWWRREGFSFTLARQRVLSILSPCHRNDSCLFSFFMISKPLSPHQRQDICMKYCIGTIGTQPVRMGVFCGNCDVSYLCIYIYLICSIHKVRKQSIFTFFFSSGWATTLMHLQNARSNSTASRDWGLHAPSSCETMFLSITVTYQRLKCNYFSVNFYLFVHFY